MTHLPPEKGKTEEVGDRAADPPQPRRLELVFGVDSIPPGAPTSIPPPAPVPAHTLHTENPLALAQRRMIRSLAAWIALTGIATALIALVCVAQWALGRGNVPSAVLLVVSFAVGLWNVMAGVHLGRVFAKGQRDADQLVRAFSHLRSIFILRAISLFLVLALSCFAFSILASFLALIS